MKPKLLLCLALVLSGLFRFKVAAQDVSSTNKWSDYTSPPQSSKADFSITHPISVHVPTRLKVERTADLLSVTTDTNDFESTNLMVGTNVETVVLGKLFVWPANETRPTNWTCMSQGGLDFNLGTIFLSTNLDGLPQPGKSYIVEMDWTAFETETRNGPSLFPWSTNYEIIWQQTLKQVVK